MNDETELTIYELAERWDDLKWNYGIEKLLITECFNGNEESYVVSGMSLELEKDIAMCDDYKNVIESRLSVLMMFIINSLTKIVLFPYKNWYKERLEFGTDGVIYIERL